MFLKHLKGTLNHCSMAWENTDERSWEKAHLGFLNYDQTSLDFFMLLVNIVVFM